MQAVAESARHGRNPALDGLRGMAVIFVILAHCNIPFVRYGGTVGVAIFFVLSGYLITDLLLRERDRHGGVSLGSFYARRALRLLPALVVALAVGSVLGIANGHGTLPVLKHALACLFYLGNITPSLGIENAGPFAHFWTLALEEQFYVVWPVILLIVSRLGRTAVGVTALVIAALSLVARFAGSITTVAGFDRAYTYPDTNAYAIALGCALAVWLGGRADRITVPRAVWWISAGIEVVAACALGLRYGLHEPANAYSRIARLGAGTAGAVAALGLVTAVVVWSRRSPSLIPAWVTSRWLVFVGTISYGLYLWHELFSDIVGDHLGTEGVRGMASGFIGLALASGAALLSWRYVEQPFLRRKGRFERVR